MVKIRMQGSSKAYMEVVSKTLTQVEGKTCMEVVRTKDHLQANSKTDMEGNSWTATRVISTRRSSSVALVAVVGEPGPSSQAEVFMVFQAVEMASVMQLQTLSAAVAMALPLLRTAGITPPVTLQTVVDAIILQRVASRMHPSGMMPTEILRPPATNEDA